jgi:hypothetical protein
VRFCCIRRTFLLGLREICKRRLWKRESFSIGAPFRNLEEGVDNWGMWETD